MRKESRPTPGNAERPGNAELQLGMHGHTGRPHAGWHSRGYLPHLDAPGVVQSVTFRLADSLPRQVVRRLDHELRAQPASTANRLRRERVDAWLDAGLGCCALAHPRVAALVQDALLRFDGERYRLCAWCIMPNHVHVLVEPHRALARIVQSWKSYTGRWALVHEADPDLRVAGGRLWMRDYWDRYIRDERHYRAVVAYIHANPVKAGLCAAPADWPWSSARLMAGDGP
ncbi:MAG: transposase [Halofilum sp. (in: g-proteobacteria)]|nr:transposase [Halofilum sp. (in: g-proteobacteria)]